jgi:hypothetical protein
MMFTYPTDALTAMKTLVFQGEPVSLAGTFKGMLFHDKATPLKVASDSVIFRTPGIKVCLTMREHVYVFSPVLPATIRATPQVLSNEAGTLRLFNFAFTGSLWYERCEQRIQPEDPLFVEILLNGVRWPATIQDFSLKGARLWVDLPQEQIFDVVVNAPLTMIIPAGDKDFYLRAQIANRRITHARTVSIGLRLRPTDEQRAWINALVARRQLEILAELDALINLQMEPQVIQAQYF